MLSKLRNKPKPIGKLYKLEVAAKAIVFAAAGKQNYRLFPCFEYIFCEALILTGHYHEGLIYVDYALNNYPEKHPYVDIGYFEKLRLWKALALSRLGDGAHTSEPYLTIANSSLFKDAFKGGGPSLCQ